jgi:predicted metal-binding membrane protein
MPSLGHGETLLSRVFMRNDQDMITGGVRIRAVPAIPPRDRILIVSCIVLVTGLAWAYLVQRVSEMVSAHPSPMPDMAMTMRSATWGAAELVLTFFMWAVMMVGMMGPSALPVLLVFGASHARRADRGVPTIVLLFGLGYLTVWLGFSAGATIAQWALSQGALLSSSMDVVGPWLGGVLLVLAGVYQLSPVKRACLEHCQSPMSFLMSHWRDGARGAFEMGLRHGLYCLGCCWALMAVLFVVGVMNLVWVGALTVFILAERIGRIGARIATIGGAAMVGVGLGMLILGM